MENGFSLIEILITLTIMGILASISFPMYQHHIVNSRRRQAIFTLGQLSMKLEHQYSATHNYQQTQTAPEKNNTLYYQFKITTPEPNQFIAQAIPQNAQAQKDPCGILSLNEQGIKSIATTSNSKTCWR